MVGTEVRDGRKAARRATSEQNRGYFCATAKLEIEPAKVQAPIGNRLAR